MSIDCVGPLSQDDRETLSNMLLPLFEEAWQQKSNVTRDLIRMELGKFFPWPHIAETLKELEELDYIDLLSTRGGGIYIPGEKFLQWSLELAVPEAPAEMEAPSGGAEGVVLSRAEAEALVALVRELAAPAPGEDALKKAHAALTEKAAADIIRSLAGPRGSEASPRQR